jgi:hypothetical protein
LYNDFIIKETSGGLRVNKFRSITAQLCGAISTQDSKTLNPIINETCDKALLALSDIEDVDSSRLLKYIEELSSTLESCAEMIETWGAYADPYFQKKWSLDADIAYAKSHAKRAANVSNGNDLLGEYDE